jgi:hypothetical protein
MKRRGGSTEYRARSTEQTGKAFPTSQPLNPSTPQPLNRSTSPSQPLFYGFLWKKVKDFCDWFVLEMTTPHV